MNKLSKRLNRILGSILIGVCSILSIGCTDSNVISSDYKFGVVYTSDQNGSRIATYTDNGKHIEDKKLKNGGITLASFMAFGMKDDNYIYYPCPVYKNKGNSYILQLDTNNLNVSEIVSEDYITPKLVLHK